MEGILNETGLDCQYLELEITKSTVMKGKGNIIETLSIFKNMGLGVIVEGVETKHQLDFLNQGMCGKIQGFYYFKPMQVHEVEELFLG